MAQIPTTELNTYGVNRKFNNFSVGEIVNLYSMPRTSTLNLKQIQRRGIFI